MKPHVRILALCGLLFFLTSLPFAQDIIQVSNTPGQAELPFIKIMQDGRIMIIYGEGHHFNSDSTLYFRIHNPVSGSWSAEEKAVTRISSSAYPQLAMDHDGDLHLTYHDGNASSNRDIHYARFDFNQYAWKPQKLAYQSLGVNSSWPRIQVDPDNEKVFIVWSHNYVDSVGEMDLVMIENPFNGTWPVPTKNRLTISDTTWSVSIHGDFKFRDNKVYCVWMDDEHKPGNWNIYYNEGVYHEEAWAFGNTVRLFPADVNQYYPALELDDEGNVHILFSYKNNPMFHAIKSGNTWSNPKPISTQATDQNMFAVLKYKAGLLHSAWRQAQNVVYARGLTDGTWTDPVKLVDGQFPGYPGVDVDDNGDAHVVWSDGDPDHPRNIYYTKVELPGKAPTAVIKANPINGIIPLTVNFNGASSSDADGNIVDYRWTFGDGSAAQGKKVTYTYKSQGPFTATLTVIDNDLRTGTDSIEITPHTGTPFPVIEASATTGMRPLTVVFDGSGSMDYDGIIMDYVWEFGDGTGANGVTATHVYESGGDFTAKLSVTDDHGKVGVATQVISVFQPPVALFTADTIVGVPPLVVNFDASASYDEDGEIKTYKWDFGDGLSALSKKVVHTYSTPGEFTVYLIVVDDDNYTGTASQVIKVLDKPLAPVNIKTETMANRAGFFTDYITKVTWEANPHNSSLLSIVNYRVYRKAQGAADSSYTMVGEVSGSTFEYMEQGHGSMSEAQSYVYTVTAVDDAGNESDFASLTNPGTLMRTAPRDTRIIRK